MRQINARKKFSTSAAILSGGLPQGHPKTALHPEGGPPVDPFWEHGGDYAFSPKDKVRIGTREHVGWGASGDMDYHDSFSEPFPAIRFKEDKEPLTLELRVKEKGDWHNFTIDEIKHLYRQSYCSTFEEMFAGSKGEWKPILGTTLWVGVAVGLLFQVLYNFFVYPDLPPTVTDPELVQAQLKRMIDLELGYLTMGPACWWDYEKMEWKEEVMKKGGPM